jgi:hypothetical protein
MIGARGSGRPFRASLMAFTAPISDSGKAVVATTRKGLASGNIRKGSKQKNQKKVSGKITISK